MPKTRIAFWEGKFKQNCRRDSRNQEDLRRLGWEFLIVWACETRDTEALRIKLSRFVGDVFSGVGMGCGGGCTADLDNADLTGSNPSQAELENATLRNTDLKEADLTNMNLEGAKLENAKKLSGALDENERIAGSRRTGCGLVQDRFPHDAQAA